MRYFNLDGKPVNENSSLEDLYKELDRIKSIIIQKENKKPLVNINIWENEVYGFDIKSLNNYIDKQDFLYKIKLHYEADDFQIISIFMNPFWDETFKDTENIILNHKFNIKIKEKIYSCDQVAQALFGTDTMRAVFDKKDKDKIKFGGDVENIGFAY